MAMKRLGGFFLMCLLAGSLAAQPLKVAVASNIAPAFREIASDFTRITGTPVEAVYDQAGKLTAQIINGHPYRLFLSSDDTFPQILHADGLTIGPPQPYATGTIVLWSMRPDFTPANWQRWLQTTSGSIAVPSPQFTAYGQMVLQILDYYHLRDGLKKRQINGANVAQTALLVNQKVADAGFVSLAEVMSPANRGRGRWVIMPAASHPPIILTMVLLRGAESDPAAKRLFHYLTGPTAGEVLRRYGYTPPVLN